MIRRIRRWLREWLGIKSHSEIIYEQEKSMRSLEQRIAALEQPLRGIGTHEERICNLELRADPHQELILGRLTGLDIITQAHASEFSELNKLRSELNAALQEMRQIREQVLDPKKIPVQTRNSRQFRALVEQDIGG